MNNKFNTPISWDKYFINVSYLSSLRSKDPSTQVGCCIVNQNKRILGVGYNGAPSNISDKDIPWNNNDISDCNNKYNYIIHAEINAILNSYNVDLSNCTLYTTHFPCNDCAKIIIQKNIIEVKYIFTKHYDKDICKISRILLKKAKIKCTKLEDSLIIN